MNRIASFSAPRRPRAWLPAALLWTLPLLVAVGLGAYAKAPEFLGQGAGRARPRLPSPPSDLPTILYQLGVGSVVWYATLAACPLLLIGARRFDTTRGHRLGVATIVAATLASAIGLTLLADYFITFRGLPVRPPLRAFAMPGLRKDVLPWLALFGAVGALEWRRRAVRAEVERERMRAEASEQRLLALMGQLRPHFLFNTLQAISTLLHRDPAAADEMLGRLSDLLRAVLEHRDRAFVALHDEIALTLAYLEIAKARMGERLVFSVDIPKETESLEVPLFILQPLVENALTHGAGARLAGGHIWIRASRAGERLRLEVEDDGPGMPSRPLREGVGLGNTRERLRESFGDNQAFALEPRAGGGVTARVEVPWRAHEPAGDVGPREMNAEPVATSS